MKLMRIIIGSMKFIVFGDPDPDACDCDCIWRDWIMVVAIYKATSQRVGK